MRKRVLIIDDEPLIRQMLRQALGNAGFDVADVGTAREAFLTAREQPPDLIICDLQLDESDGLEVIDTLKRQLPAVPVMLLTGVLFDSEVAGSVVGDKISAYVEKTAPLRRVLEEARRLLNEPPRS